VIFYNCQWFTFSLNRNDTTDFCLRGGWCTELDDQERHISTWQAGRCRFNLISGLQVCEAQNHKSLLWFI